MEEIVKKNLHEIEKSCKKNENKLKNLALKIRDKSEEKYSSRLIQEHRRRRSGSRSKRDSSPYIMGGTNGVGVNSGSNSNSNSRNSVNSNPTSNPNNTNMAPNV